MYVELTNPINYFLLATNAWLINHGFQLNSREWAGLIWLGVLAAWAIPKAQFRRSLGVVIRSAMSPKLRIVWISFLLWVTLFVILAQWLRIWDTRLTKDTLLWSTTTGVALLAGFTDAHKTGFFRGALWKIVGILALVEYLVSLSAFPLLVEVLLQPLILLFATAPILVKEAEEKQRWQGWSNRFFVILAVMLLGNTGRSLLSDWGSRDWLLFSLRAGWPVGLSIWLLPLVYIWALVSSYEQAFLRPEWTRNNQLGLWKAKIGLVLGLGPRLEWIHQATKGRTYHISRAQSLKAAMKLAREFKRELLSEKRVEQTYQENLRKFAGSSGVDGHRRPSDRREFRETRKVLDWLHTCHMGWFRHEPSGYKPELLSRIGDDFRNQGLPNPSGIVMEVAADGTKWYAWRRTVGGHYFGIGANGDPPNQWRYDGRNPPTGFPGLAPEWGLSPFDDDVSLNWYE